MRPRPASAAPTLGGCRGSRRIGAIVSAELELYKQTEETRFQTAIGEQARGALPERLFVRSNTNSRIWVDYTSATASFASNAARLFSKLP